MAAERARDESVQSQTLLSIIHVTIPQLVFSILIAFLFKWLDVYLATHIPYSRWPMPDTDDYTTLLGAISAIGGVFIGLYYAGVTAVGSTVYAHVPNNVRDLLARETVGNVYMRYLAFLTFLSLILISFKALGMPKLRVAIPVLAIMSGIGIVAFIKLGQRAFYLFDPTALADSLFRELRQLVKRACVGGLGWSDMAFQGHANKKAETVVTTLRTVADMSNDAKNLSGRPFAELCKQLLRFLIFYEKAKEKIPSESRWYTRRVVHRDWYRTADDRISLAHTTGTVLDPDSIPNSNWLEEQLLPIISRCILTNVRDGNFELVFELLQFYDGYIKRVAENTGPDRALTLVDQFATELFSTIGLPAELLILDAEVLEHIGLIDYIGSLPINCLLGFLGSEHNGDDDLQIKLHGIKWHRKSAIYTRGFKAYLLPRLEWLQPRLELERFAEGSWKSPLWYQADIVRIEAANHLAKDITAVVDRALKTYESWVNTFQNNKHPWLAAAAVGRQWEYSNKVQAHLGKLEKRWNKLLAGRKHTELEWPTSDQKNWKGLVREFEQTTQAAMAGIGAILTLSKRPDKFPDYPGQFVHATGESILCSLIDGDVERITKLFPPYLLGCLKKFDELRPASVKPDDESLRMIRVAGASLLDLICLSGYARLFADVHSTDEIWTAITDAWDTYLAATQPSPLPMFAAILSLTEGFLGVPHRGVLRTQWTMTVNKKLAELPRRDIVRGDSLIFVERIAESSSPLVRVFARDRTVNFYGGEHIFSAFYLKKREGGAALSWGRKTTDLEEAITRSTDETE